MKLIITLLFIIILFSCTSHYKACRDIHNLVYKDITCESGYKILGITGHPPSCLDIKNLEELRQECPSF